MTKNHEKSLVFGTVLSLLVAGLDAYLSQRTGMVFFLALMPFAVMAACVCALVLIRVRLGRLSQAEQRDERLAREERPDASLFGEDGEDAPLTIERGRRQLERVVVPVVTGILIVLQAAWAFWLWKKVELVAPGAVAKDALLAATFLLGQGFVLFLSSRYLTGLSRTKSLRLYRGPGISTGIASLVSFLAVAIALLSLPLQTKAVVAGSYVLVALVFVLAVEGLLNMIVAFYSPQRKFLTGVAYESRLANFLTDPARMAQNVAQTVDYQFGLDVSQNWYATVLKTTLIPLLATAGILVYLLTSIVVLAPEEQGVLERYGRPVDEGWLLDSGLHIKKPWPFETVKRVPAKRLQRVNLGFVEGEAENEHEEKVLVWTQAHYEDESPFLVYNPLEGAATEGVISATTTSTPLGVLNANIPLQYEISDLKSYAYRYANPQEMVEKTATRVLTREMASRTLADLLVADRSAVSAELKQGIQAEFDRPQLGVSVRFIGIYSLHPPIDVAPAYEGVVDAIAEQERAILEARAYEEKTLPQARADAEKLVQEATVYKVERQTLAAAEATHFEKRLAAFEKGGDVFKTREYLRALRAGAENQRKFIVDSDIGGEIINFSGFGGMDVPSLLLDEDAKAKAER